jgi:3-oxoacyl-[acyl-carrier-protein] synthase III
MRPNRIRSPEVAKLNMRFENVSIVSVEHIDAPIRVTSKEIEERLRPTMDRLRLPPNLLRELSGIEARRWWNEGVVPSDAAATAGGSALEAAGIDPRDIGVLVNTSVCRDFVEPSTACIAHHKIGLSETCINFDITNACLGFVNGMDVVGNMIERGQVEFGLLVDAESSRYTVECTIERLLQPGVDHRMFRDQFATLTLGSCGVAMVLGRSDLVANGHPYLGGVTLAATEHNQLCTGFMHEMVTDTKALTDAGLELAVKTWAKAADELGWQPDTHQHYAQHQTTKGHADKFAGVIGLDLQKVYRLYPEYGNVGPAGVAVVLSKLEDEGLVVTGERVAMMGIGSGINCSMVEVVW